MTSIATMATIGLKRQLSAPEEHAQEHAPAAMAPLLKYPGAKWRLAPWIVQHMPPHLSYLEPFAGSLAVLFVKPRSRIETVNDLNGDIVNFFTVCREQPKRLADALALTPWAREEREAAFRDGLGYLKAQDEHAPAPTLFDFLGDGDGEGEGEDEGGEGEDGGAGAADGDGGGCEESEAA